MTEFHFSAGKVAWFLRRRPRPTILTNKKTKSVGLGFLLVGDGGFGPPKSVTTDLQSAPFGRSGNPPDGAGDRSRTNNLLITNQLLCH